MKIGIITFHRAINYGAVLQSYALQYYLNKLGIDAEIIDYKCQYLEKRYRKFYKSSNGIKGIISGILYYYIRSARINSFNKFRKENIKISQKNISKNELPYVGNQYDYIITGSDQVWNPKQSNYDMSYFLDFVPANKRISYAASLGTITMNDINIKICKKYLPKYRLISVREEYGADIIENLLNKKVTTVLDPVFLLSENEWMKFIYKKRIVKDSYIFVYCLHEKSCYSMATELSKRTNKKIVCIPDSLKTKIKGKKDFTAGLEDFLNYIYYADYIITDSFHASAFSIIFKKQFSIILKTEKKDLNGRLTSLASEFNIQKKLVYNNQYLDINDEIDYEKIKYIMEKKKRHSKKFIESIIG